MAGPLTLSSWPGTSGDPSLAYFSHFTEQFQFGIPASSGVLPSRSSDIPSVYASEFKVTGDSTGMQVKVAQGRAAAKGVFAKLQDSAVTGGVYTLTVSTAHATLQRVDRVVLEFDLGTGAVTLKMSNGTPAAAGSATAPALTQTSATWQLGLAIVVVDAAASTVAAIDVVDTREFAITGDALAEALASVNPIINGGMTVWNDGTSLAAIADGTYAAEMWLYRKAGAIVHTVSQDATVVPGIGSAGESYEPYSTKFDVTTADGTLASGDYATYEQRIEGPRFRKLYGRDFSYTFWFQSPKIGVHYVAFVNAGGDRSCVVPFWVNAADAVARYTVHVPRPAASGGTWSLTEATIGVRVIHTLSCGATFQASANGVWQTGLFFGTSRQANTGDNTSNNAHLMMCGRMNPGGLALDFAPHNDERALTRRYYQTLLAGTTIRNFALGRANTTTVATFPFTIAPMMTVPTVAWSAEADFNINYAATGVTITSKTFDQVNVDGFRVVATATSAALTAGDAVALAANVSGNAKISMSARL